MSRALIIFVVVSALAGFVFSSVSTYDFAQHLDRQVHGIHCSFVPGLADTESGSDCEVTLMSRYSSVMRTSVWGGVPISLPSMAVFAFLFFFGIDILLARREKDPRSTGFYVAATALPVSASIVMGMIALGELDAACKSCIGIYLSSFSGLLAATVAWVVALRSGRFQSSVDDSAGASESLAIVTTPKGRASWGYLAGAFAAGVAFVVVNVLAYVAFAPDHSNYIGTCGTLKKSPSSDLTVPIGDSDGTIPALEVFDPLCPACRGLEEALTHSESGKKLKREAVLFPLDSECNWMLSDPLHPGACAVSEAILCAGTTSASVIDWAFENQEKIHEAAKADPKAARRMIKERFPTLAKCVGSARAKQKLNRSLRWTVENKLPILTPQLYIKDKKVCDEDLDLGLEFSLSRMTGGE